ncbi:hypothetical protein L1987_02242 [Smallanthus sonchifolius]|uniref:Uncharacterized protein n=1 Tax=Smallanthus sonchifolius TaxID=185202 RepID=A0ACB9K7G8_9ASTR|nr:hypothetical protein L1987_02242 [Smallanthus sonchifolius]
MLIDKRLSYLLLLVCDEAKHLSWAGERFKVVTIDGILLTKAGGTSGGMEASPIYTWQYFIGLKKKKEGLEAELQEFGSIREMQLKESEASGKISGLEKKIQYAEIKKKNMEKLFVCFYLLPRLPIVAEAADRQGSSFGSGTTCRFK